MQLEGMQFSHYRLLRSIGSGGSGQVYLANDIRHTERQLAIKVMHTSVPAEQLSDESREAIRLFQREIQAVTKLDHARILPLYDAGEDIIRAGEQPVTLQYIVMPYRPAGSLATWHKHYQQSSKLVAPALVAHIVQQAAEALQHAHDRHIIHQDIKPSNFLLRSESHPEQLPDILLADFGCAKISTVTTTLTHNVRGTPPYMAPEQWNGHTAIATDQYALAIMAYYFLTNSFPFSGALMQVVMQHMNAIPAPPSQLNPAIQPELDAVILRALAKKPEERFPSVTLFAQAFYQATHLTASFSQSISGPNPITPFPLSQAGSPSSMPYAPALSGPPSHPPFHSMPGQIIARQEAESPATPHHLTPGWAQYAPPPLDPTMPGQPVSQPGFQQLQPQPRNKSAIWLLTACLIVLLGIFSALLINMALQNTQQTNSPSPTAIIDNASTATALAAQQATATMQQHSTPTSTLTAAEQGGQLVQRYYTYINQKNYNAAYDLWLEYDGTREDFSEGYANTVQNQVAINLANEQGDGTVRINITLAASVQDTNGSITNETYSGYFIVGLDGATWKIFDASLSPI